MRTVMFFFTLILLIIPGSNLKGNTKNTKSWRSGETRITLNSPKCIHVIHQGKTRTYKFNLTLYDLIINPSNSYILLAVYDRSEALEMNMDLDEHLDYMLASKVQPVNCQVYLIDLRNGKKHLFFKNCVGGIHNIWSPNGYYMQLGLTIIKTADILKYLNKLPYHTIEIKGVDTCIVIEYSATTWINNDVLKFSGCGCGTEFDFLYYIKKKKLETYCGETQREEYGCGADTKKASELRKRLQQLKKQRTNGANVN